MWCGKQTNSRPHTRFCNDSTRQYQTAHGMQPRIRPARMLSFTLYLFILSLRELRKKRNLADVSQNLQVVHISPKKSYTQTELHRFNVVPIVDPFSPNCNSFAMVFTQAGINSGRNLGGLTCLDSCGRLLRHFRDDWASLRCRSQLA